MRNIGSGVSGALGIWRSNGRNRSRHSSTGGIFLVLLLSAMVTCHAFLQNPATGMSRAQKLGQDSSSSLCLLRPDWMRRAGRIEQKRKERREIFDALRKRQDELGMPQTLFRKRKDPKPKKYLVVSATDKSDNYNGTVSSNGDGLAIYPYIPDDEVEANDESNILDWLDHGEIVTAIRSKTVADESVPPPPMAVMAATAIYNIDPKIQRDVLWIEHDRGGWSPTIVDGTTRLIPLD
eukprot:CAMPEP_0116115594 /NCGR_PEP_ID=MMETSP0329-20121206/587_1 /TAXON_ID=697910 /ORGANISM="Pseudo-nitzschia arenysensis, Strain B593" /LENGTH=235 /DNA_ID=CAMNT_0003609031 /DNA_START=121 /DNA_END=828 /DNA_ORIENTATION=-